MYSIWCKATQRHNSIYKKLRKCTQTNIWCCVLVDFSSIQNKQNMRLKSTIADVKYFKLDLE